MHEQKIVSVIPDSPAADAGIQAGDVLVSLNGMPVQDIFDYHYLAEDVEVTVTVRHPDGEEECWIIEKDEDEDLGLVFPDSLMDDYRSCRNKCIFCFIDQNPPGMRETIYFKDDDSRLSFLQGNYITMTNMKEEEIDRIIRYKLAPINISVHTTNPELRKFMLHNRFAGNILEHIDKLYAAEIPMNGQIVLCKGVNDGEELYRSIKDLSKYAPVMESLSVVPVGLSCYREGLHPLEPFTKEDAEEVIDMIEGFQKEIYAEHGIHFVHASDEWYILAGREMPSEESYDGYLQIENGVGMTRLMYEDFRAAVDELEAVGRKAGITVPAIASADPNRSGEMKINGAGEATSAAAEASKSGSRKEVSKKGRKPRLTREEKELLELLTLNPGRKVSAICGMLAYRTKDVLLEELRRIRPDISYMIYPIRNDFFGPRITVTGLLTGQDIVKQLKEKDLGENLLISCNCLKADEDVFLDDMKLSELENALQVKTIIVKSYGMDFLRDLIGG